MFFLTQLVLYQIIFCVFVFRNPSWYQKKIIVLLHTFSAYNSLLVCFKVYLPDPRESLSKSWRYDEAYENFSIDPAAFWKNPIKKYNCHIKLSAPNTRRKLHWNKSVTAKASLENLVRNVLNENYIWNRTFQSAV